MPIFISALVPHRSRDPHWQFQFAFNSSTLDIDCIEIKSLGADLIDDHETPPLPLRKVTFIYMRAKLANYALVIMVSKAINKQKSVTVLQGLDLEQFPLVRTILSNTTRQPVQVAFACLNQSASSLLHKDNWTHLSIYVPLAFLYYKRLHEGIRLDLVEQLALKPSIKKLDITEIGCGYADALRLVLGSLPDNISYSAQAIDFDVKNLEVAKERSANFPQITFTQDDFFAVNANGSFFDRTYRMQPNKEPNTLRIMISSGGLSVATVPSYEDLLWLLQEAHRYKVDMMLIGSIVAMPWHLPSVKRIGFDIAVRPVPGCSTQPLYILHYSQPDYSFNKIAALLKDGTKVHLNLQFCEDPLGVLSGLTQAERSPVASIDISFCRLSESDVVKLDTLLASFPSLRLVTHRRLRQADLTELPLSTNHEWKWNFLAPSLQETLISQFFSRRATYFKTQVFQGISTGSDLSPYISNDDCRVIVDLYNNSGVTSLLDKDTTNAYTLNLLEAAAHAFPLLLLVVIHRCKTGYKSNEDSEIDENELLDKSGYVGCVLLCSTYDPKREITSYKALRQKGFFSDSLYCAIMNNRIREIEAKKSEVQAYDEALDLFREANNEAMRLP